MDEYKKLSAIDIQFKLEEWIYDMNSAKIINGRYHIILAGYEGGYEPLSNEQLDELDDGDPEFYSKQFAHTARASVIVKMESIKKGVPKIEILFTPGKIDKSIFSDFIKFGWKINNYTFKYTCTQDEVFTNNYKTAYLIFNTIECLNQYMWKLEQVNDSN